MFINVGHGRVIRIKDITLINAIDNTMYIHTCEGDVYECAEKPKPLRPGTLNVRKTKDQLDYYDLVHFWKEVQKEGKAS